MSGYIATLEDCAGSIFNRVKTDEMSRLCVEKRISIRRAWAIFSRVRQYRKAMRHFSNVLNIVFTGDENADFYALDTMFVERTYLMDKDVLETLEGLRHKTLEECDIIRREAEKIEKMASKSGFMARHILSCAVDELSKCFDIMDSCLFAIEEVLAYAKNKKRKGA